MEYIKVIGKGWFGKVIETDAKNISPMTKSKKVIVKQLRDDANDHEQMRKLLMIVFLSNKMIKEIRHKLNKKYLVLYMFNSI